MAKMAFDSSHETNILIITILNVKCSVDTQWTLTLIIKSYSRPIIHHNNVPGRCHSLKLTIPVKPLFLLMLRLNSLARLPMRLASTYTHDIYPHFPSIHTSSDWHQNCMIFSINCWQLGWNFNSLTTNDMHIITCFNNLCDTCQLACQS